jgi:pantoate kinase
MMKIDTFCPGHVTGFFQICEHRDLWRSGSRGAGLCLDLGAHTTLEMEEGNGEVFVKLDGREAKAPVTELAVSKVIEDRRLDVQVDTRLDLPVSQGFGMSAAGALSAAHGLTELLRLPFKVALRAAHEAEVESHTGLGDVAALSRGGMTFRRVEGLPPFGKIDRINAEPDVVLCVIGAPLLTEEVLRDEKLRQRVNAVGRECVAKMALSPTMATLMRLSREFMTKTHLASPEVEEAVKAAEDYGPASMAMLGNSVFAVGKAKDQDRVLSERGGTFKAKVDWRGPRVIAGELEAD